MTQVNVSLQSATEAPRYKLSLESLKSLSRDNDFIGNDRRTLVIIPVAFRKIHSIGSVAALSKTCTKTIVSVDQ